jgi:hypothetical protein
MNPHHLARTDHPAESKAAAQQLVASGSHAQMCAIALELVTLHPGKTANELDEMFARMQGDGVFGTITKRLSDLFNRGELYKGPSRKSTVTNRMNATWYRTTNVVPEFATGNP